jgi:hypothetical protein
MSHLAWDGALLVGSLRMQPCIAGQLSWLYVDGRVNEKVRRPKSPYSIGTDLPKMSHAVRCRSGVRVVWWCRRLDDEPKTLAFNICA